MRGERGERGDARRCEESEESEESEKSEESEENPEQSWRRDIKGTTLKGETFKDSSWRTIKQWGK